MDAKFSLLGVSGSCVVGDVDEWRLFCHELKVEGFCCAGDKSVGVDERRAEREENDIVDLPGE